jgi:hypothetical protein
MDFSSRSDVFLSGKPFPMRQINRRKSKHECDQFFRVQSFVGLGRVAEMTDHLQGDIADEVAETLVPVRLEKTR